jgi:hypothetical protein
MSKATDGHTMPKTTRAMSRRSMLASGGSLAAGAVIATSATASDVGAEWPEFRRWYCLMLQAEAINMRLVSDEDLSDEDKLSSAYDGIIERMYPLEEAMRDRSARSHVDTAVLAHLALFWTDKKRDRLHAGRFLVLGGSKEDPANCFDMAAIAAIEATVSDAVERNLLPGVKVWEEGVETDGILA